MLDLKNIERKIPKVRPLRSFIHFHLFPEQLQCNIWQALSEISSTYSCPPMLPHGYWSLFKDLGWIQECSELNDWKLNEKFDGQVKEKSFRPIHQFINVKIKASLNEFTEPILLRFLSLYFDQGISLQNMPIEPEGLLATFLNLIQSSYIPLKPFKRNQLRPFLKLNPEEIITKTLEDILPETKFYESYLEESTLSLKGWAGMIKMLEKHPELLIARRTCKLIDFLAIRCLIEWAWLKNYFQYAKPSSQELELWLSKNSRPINYPISILKRIQESLEYKHHKKFLPELKNHLSKNNDKPSPSTFSILFCIDDRECLLRRKIEQAFPEVETFGTPGFFGLDFYLQRHLHEVPIKHCPDPMHTHRLLSFKNPQPLPSWKKLAEKYSKSLINLLYSSSKIPPLVDIRPPLSLNTKEVFTEDEAAEKIFRLLQSIGWQPPSGDLVLVIGHGSTTANNAYFNAYGCGACSGGSGHINAHAFCDLINDSRVRYKIKEKGLHIPEHIHWIPGLHDTTLDLITLFVPQQVTVPHRLVHILKSALQATIEERILDFFPPDQLPASFPLKRKWIWQKGHNLFEVRPEYLHTQATYCFIGRRSLIRNFSFARTAFLQSYDYTKDPTGDYLSDILSAVVPVCGGINLDYFFSRQMLVLGAGTKLSHNINGLIGVTNGIEEDLLPGLAYQMVERHNPCRLTFVIEQNPEIVAKIIHKKNGLTPWFDNEWCLIFCFWHGSYYQYQPELRWVKREDL